MRTGPKAVHGVYWAMAAEAEPTVDPGEIINRRAHALEKSGHARSFAEAVEIAMRQLPEEAAAYHSGLRLPSGRRHRQRRARATGAHLQRPR